MVEFRIIKQLIIMVVGLFKKYELWNTFMKILI